MRSVPATVSTFECVLSRDSRNFRLTCPFFLLATIVDLGEDSSSRLDHEYRNMFVAIERAGNCGSCGKVGATVSCSEPSCSLCFHFACAEDTSWNLEKRPQFRCRQHRKKEITEPLKRAVTSSTAQLKDSGTSGIFHHALFSQGGSSPHIAVPGNLDIDRSDHRALAPDKKNLQDDTSSSSESENEQEEANHIEEKQGPPVNTVAYVLTSDVQSDNAVETTLARLYRGSIGEPWNVEFYVTRLDDNDEKDNNSHDGEKRALLSVAMARPDAFDEVRDGDIVIAINGMRVGSPELDSLEKVLSRLSQEVEAMMEVRRADW
jgi:hypothetical protein